MKPSAFEYRRPATLSDALVMLDREDDCLVLAGGQSLVPAMNFRLASPSVLVDIGGLDELGAISVTSNGIDIGANVRHRDVELSEPVFRINPLLRMAVRHVAHVPIRNRGTTVGSLCQADAAAEMPLVLVLTGGKVKAQTMGGVREIAAEDFFKFHLTTSRAENELITSAHFPALPAAAGCGFQEFARRKGDYALAAVGAIIRTGVDGRIELARLAACGVAAKPIRLETAETALIGQFPERDVLQMAGRAAAEYVTAPDDANATNSYRRHLLSGLLNRAVHQAVQGGGQ